ncbi:MAG: histidine kinase dimerization/phospho-acceptor domain-containing protein, partial [Bacteroidota bacterium]|nr:histidine kinase dimerization/phospho-acceptor domain-containing protein [Bacteroidota bacterium]
MATLLNFLRQLRLKKKIRLSSPVFLLPFCVAVFLISSFNIVTKTDGVKLTASFQKSLLKHEVNLTTKLNSFVFDLGYNETTYKSFNVIAKYYKDKNTDFFVYKNKKLVRWTSSEVTVPILFNDSLSKSSISWFAKGNYLVKHKRIRNFDYLAVELINNDYAFRNDYLISRFNPTYDLPQETETSDKATPYKVFSKDKGSSLFLIFPRTETHDTFLLISFIIFLFILFLIAVSIYKYLKYRYQKFALKQFIIYFLLLCLIRLLLTLIPIPHALESSQLFSPFLYASSDVLPSLGHLIINTLFLLFFSVAYYLSSITTIDPQKATLKNSIFWFFIFSLLIDLISFRFIDLTDSFVTNSNIPLNLSNIFSTNIYSFFIIFILFLLSLSYYFFVRRYYLFHFKNFTYRKSYLIVCSFVAFITLLPFYFESTYTIPYIVIFLFQVLLIYNVIYLKTKNSLVYQLFLLILLSLFISSILYNSTQIKEKEIRKSLAYKLTTKRDKLAEFLYSNIEKSILQDALIKKYLRLAIAKPDSEYRLLDYIKTKFSNNYWNKYEVQPYICDTVSQLEMKPTNQLVSCEDYFSSKISKMGLKTISNNLYYLDEIYAQCTYIAKIDFPKDDNSKQQISVYLEFYPKITTSNLGYPELLIDDEFYQKLDLSEYSYAIYNQNDLVKSVGDYKYSLNLQSTDPNITTSAFFFNKNSYNHLFVKTSPFTSILVSRKMPNLISTLSFFSYIFLFSALLYLLFRLISSKSPRIMFSMTIKQRLQFWTITIILLSSIAIGCVMLFYLFNLEKRKNQNTLNEKAHSVLVELEQKINDPNYFNGSQTPMLSDLLSKLSNVFFTDINLFDKNGDLMATSRPQLFDAQLLSIKMNPKAYCALHDEQQILETLDEKIGNYTFQSAYIPLRDVGNRTLGYINLPYFAKESEFRTDVSTFLVAFINIYVILTVLAILVALLVSNYITLPLQIIKDKISQINYFKKPEKIEWAGSDELAELIAQYNQMVEDLAHSAEMLASSERESAWRVMAQQVAHEIKNPLTPMKLSVQHLEKAWLDKSPDFEKRLKRFTQTMITQIEALSTISGEFSDFAKMPASVLEKVNLNQSVKEAAMLFSDSMNLSIELNLSNGDIQIKADKQQIARILNNLFRNSIQSIPANKQGQITISTYEDNKFSFLEFSDNGSGIKPDLQP